MVGVGYKAAVSGSNLTLNLGYSHPIEMAVPKGLAVSGAAVVAAGRNEGGLGCVSDSSGVATTMQQAVPSLRPALCNELRCITRPAASHFASQPLHACPPL